MSGINFTSVRGSIPHHTTTDCKTIQYFEKTTAGDLRSRILRNDCPDIPIIFLSRRLYL